MERRWLQLNLGEHPRAGAEEDGGEQTENSKIDGEAEVPRPMSTPRSPSTP